MNLLYLKANLVKSNSKTLKWAFFEIIGLMQKKVEKILFFETTYNLMSKSWVNHELITFGIKGI